MRIIVSGDVQLEDYKLVKRKLDAITIKLTKVEIAITGMKGTYIGSTVRQQGAEFLATRWCAFWKHPYFIYHTETFFQGDKANNKPDQRLEQMFAEADAAVFFWDGSTKKTKELIQKAKRSLGKDKVRVIVYEEE